MIAKNLAWITPFLFFIGGFFIAKSLLDVQYLKAPSVVGSTLSQAFTTLSNCNLSCRLSIQKIDSDLPDGTVLSQTPAAGQMVKPRQTVFLTLSKRPEKSLAPDMVGKKSESILKMAKNSKIKLKQYALESIYPAHTCIGQFPAPGAPLEDTLTIYVASPQTPLYIWPDFTGKSLQEVRTFLEQYGIEPHSIDYTSGKPSHHPIVTSQRPLAGTLISITEKQHPIVQLYVH